MSDKEENLPGHRDARTARRNKRREKKAALSAETASKKAGAEVENMAEPNTSEAEKDPKPEDPSLEGTASRSKEEPEMSGAEEKKAAFSQTAKAPQRRPAYKAAERDSSVRGDSRGRGRGKFSIGLMVLVLIIVLVAIGNAYYSWFLVEREREARQALSEKLIAQLDAQIDAQVEARISSQIDKQLSGTGEPLRQDITGLKREVDEHTEALKMIQRETSALESALRVLRTATEEGPQSGSWDIAEVAYLMRIASERLQLEQDVNTALVALQTADRILEKAEDPALAPVRSKLTEEIDALKAVPVPDISGMASSLASLIEQVEELELKKSTPEESVVVAEAETETKATEQVPQVPEEDSSTATAKVKEFLQVIWGDFKQMVTVRQRGEGESAAPVLSPKEHYFLYQNLRLKLESARLSLLRKSEEGFQHSLQLAQQWLQTYFQGPKAEAMKNSLARLAQIPISPDLPDISGSLKALDRVLQHTTAQTAGNNEGGKA